MKQSPLIAENKLEQAESGLWHLPGFNIEEHSFAYSDGDTEEAYILDVISQASDTSSTSPELEKHIHDWPSEYHLTSKRANLLRALDLSCLEHVLELGCGCGAISRYLAEQGLNVDAVEGSHRRASIAHARCRNLDNINIINTNFNDVRLPAESYDAVFLIGVLEYAKRFFPEADNDRSAVMQILEAVQGCLRPGGVVVTAIENRLGLKYLMGASEDHYGVPFIGVHQYPQSAGIRTYDYGEWKSILGDAGFAAFQFLLPFPDYKIPSTILHQGFLEQPGAATHLRGSVSRDYLRALDSNFNEYLFWQASAQNGTLTEYANSYLIVAGNRESVHSLTSYDFVHITGSQRQPGFRTITSKKRYENIVYKQKLVDTMPVEGDTWLHQRLADEPYLQGQLLADIWLQTLMAWQDQARLLDLYQQYFSFLREYQSGHPDARDILDVLPFNIVINAEGRYQSFDREWVVDEQLTPEFVLFRALFWFVYGNSAFFAPMFRAHGWASIREYIAECFETLGLRDGIDLDDMAGMEDRIQQHISASTKQNLVQGLLGSLPQASRGETLFNPRLYWAAPGKKYTEQNSITATAVMGKEKQSVSFRVPVSLEPGSRLRFDPAEQEGYFHLYRLRLLDGEPEAGSETGPDAKTILDLDSGLKINSQLVASGVDFYENENGSVFLAHDNDPHFELDIDTAIESPHVVIEMDWPHSEEYEIARAGLERQFGRWLSEKAELEKQLVQMNALKEENSRLQAAGNELGVIKNSRSYRLIRKLASVMGRR